MLCYGHEVRTLHLCDRKLHCVVLHSSPRAVASQGSSRQARPLRGHNRVLRGGSDRVPGSILGVPPFLVTVVTYEIRVFFEGAQKEVFSSIFKKTL